MDISDLDGAPANARGGQTAYMLLSKGQFVTEHLTVTWVDCSPGSEQPLHQHETNEQVYVIIRGRGVMIVGGDEREVGEGTLVSVPKRTSHAIRNPFDAPMAYVSATSPPIDLAELGTAFEFRAR